jgi:hypothetical protein
MVSERQLRANRCNAQRATGPRTAAGKAVASKNSIRHGIYSAIRVLPGLGETQPEWDAFCAAIVAALAPADEAERHLAERLALLAWRARRAALFEAAAATAALQPAAAALLAAPTPDPDDPLEGLRDDQLTAEARNEAAMLRRAATTVPRAVALLGRLSHAPDDEPVDPEVAEQVWRCACDAAGLPPGRAVRELLWRFWTGPGGTRSGSQPKWEYTRWSVATLRAAVAFLAAESGCPPDRLTTAVSEELAAKASFLAAKAKAAEEAVGRAVGARQAAAVEAATRAVGHGSPMLDLALRYEGHVSREMEAVLRQLTALRALREARSR